MTSSTPTGTPTSGASETGVGTSGDLTIETSIGGADGKGSEPEDFVEPIPQGAPGPLIPASLYDDQLARRLGG